MKKCHSCNGRGFIFSKLFEVKDSIKLGFGLHEKGIKKPCQKCSGKGFR